MNLYEEIEKIKEQGFSEADAQSKLGQDLDLDFIRYSITMTGFFSASTFPVVQIFRYRQSSP